MKKRTKGMNAKEYFKNFFSNEYSESYRNHLEKLKKLEEFLAENEKIITIKKVEFRQFYDSTWQVKMLLNGEVVDAKIVRDDNETIYELVKLLTNVNSKEELFALDLKESIYYD